MIVSLAELINNRPCCLLKPAAGSIASRPGVVSPATSATAARPVVRTASSTASTPIKARSSVAPSANATTTGARKPTTVATGATAGTARVASTRTPTTPVAPRTSTASTAARSATSTAPARPRSSTSVSTGVRSPVSATSTAASKPAGTSNGAGPTTIKKPVTALELQDRLKKLRAEHEETLQKLEATKADLTLKEEELKGKDEEIEKLRASSQSNDSEQNVTKDDARDENDANQIEISKLKEELSILREKFDLAQDGQSKSETALKSIQEKYEEVQSELLRTKADHESQVELHKSALLKAEEAREGALSTLATSESHSKVLQNQLEEQKTFHDQLSRQYENEKMEHTSTRQALEADSQKSATSLAAAEAEIENLRKAIEEASAKHTSDQKGTSERQTIETSLREKIATLEQRNSEVEEDAKKSAAKMVEKLKEVESRCVQSEKQREDLGTAHKSALEAANSTSSKEAKDLKSRIDTLVAELEAARRKGDQAAADHALQMDKVRKEIVVENEASIEKLTKDVDEAKAQIETLDAGLTQAKADFDTEKKDLEAQLKVKEDELEKESARLEELQKEAEAQRQTLEEVRVTASKHKEESSLLQEQLASVQAEAERLQEQYGLQGSKHSEEVTKLKGEHSALTATLEKTLASHEDRLARTQADHEKSLTSLQEQLAQMQAKAEGESTKKDASNNDEVIAGLHRKIAELEESHAMDTSTLSKEHAHEQDKLHETIASLQKRVQEIETIEKKLHLSDSELESIKKERDAIESRAKALELSNNSDRSRIEELERDLADAKTALMQTQKSFATQIEEMSRNKANNDSQQLPPASVSLI